MEILRSFPSNGAALSGQETLSESLLDSAGLDADLTGAFSRIKATVGKGAYKSGIEELLAFGTEMGPVPSERSNSSLQLSQTLDVLGVASQGTSNVPNLLRQPVVPGLIAANGPEARTANVDSLTGMADGAQLVSAAATGELKVVTPLSDRNIAPGRLVFSTVNEEPRAFKELILENTGTGPLTITDLDIGNSVENIARRSADNLRDEDFKLVNAPTGSFTIAAGGSRKISVEFDPQRNASNSADSITDTLNGENYAALTISSNDPTKPTRVVNLAGVNFADYEGDSEPSLAEISRIYGWKINIGSEKQILGGAKTPLGSEVISPYWQPADTSKPVYLWPLAVTSHRVTDPHSEVIYQPKGESSNFLYEFAGRRDDDNLPGSNSLSGGENQKLLPKILINDMNRVPGVGDVDITTTKAFALNSNGSWTIDSRNGTGDLHNWRIYPVQNAQGNLIPNTWFAGVDPGNTEGGFKNYDYQDEVYLLKNAKPAEPVPPQQLPIRLDTGSSSSYTDTEGRTWFPDAGFFTPSTVKAENRGPAQIANTKNDELYWTYRGFRSSTLTYNIPVDQPGKVDIFLRFAEMYWGAPAGDPAGGAGDRVFDVIVENEMKLNDFDIYAASGSALRAIEKSFKGIQVSDGTLNIQFKAEVDFPSIAGISVLPA